MGWLHVVDGKEYCAEVSDIEAYMKVKNCATVRCPKCKDGITIGELCNTRGRFMDKSGEDIAGWRSKHKCGAQLVVFND